MAIVRTIASVVLLGFGLVAPTYAEERPLDEAGVRIRALLERSRSATARPMRIIGPEATAERARLLEGAELALSRGESERAAEAFERAAAMLHAADAELGIVRSHMQAGRYRQALAFAAHTAGAHPDTPAGAGLYAWLLHLGGHGGPATQVISTARTRNPHAPILDETAALIASSSAAVSADMLSPPGRYAPYSPASPSLQSGYRTLGSAYLLHESNRAITDSALIQGAQGIVLRNGLGQFSTARVVEEFADLGVAVLALAEPLGKHGVVRTVAREPFAGSMAYTVRYPADDHAHPAWPQLHGGFLGAPAPGSAQFALGIEVPDGAMGGPVFDAAGRFVGLARQQSGANPLRVGVSELRARLGEALGPVDPGNARLPPDTLYEHALTQVVQVLVTR